MPKSEAIIGYLKNRPVMLLFVAAGAVLIVVGLAALAFSGASDTDNAGFATFTVKRGPLRISVTESGTIKAREQVILKNEVEGRTSILTLIPEGTRVKEGDLLVELDASALIDNQVDQEIRVQNAEAAFISAEENFAVVENQAQSDIDKAELDLDFARLDQNKYLDPNGEYQNEREAALAQITLVEEELIRANEKLKWSRELFEEKYISETELKADELAASKKRTDKVLARNNLNLLETFTHQRMVKQLQSDLKQAEMALERTKRKARADVKQAEANLKAKESEYNRQQDKLKKLAEQIAKTRIYAPSDGLAIYATSAQQGRRNVEPLAEGQEVRERQELIYLPKGTSVKAEISIHEASLKKVQTNLPAIITVDALPGRRFSGSVARIAPLPNAQSMWMNPDLKVYNTEVNLQGSDGSLRTGMSCKAEIIVEQYEDALYVPVQAVLRVAGEPTVFVAEGKKKFVPRTVKIGMDNNRMVHIISGLTAGEVVLLTPPLQSAETKPDSADTTGSAEAVDQADAVGAADHTDSAIAAEPSAVKKDPSTEPEAQPDAHRNGRPAGEQRENLSPEQREKRRVRFQNMSPEQRQKLRQQRKSDG